MGEVSFDEELDTSGLNCPMPLVKARGKIGQLASGQVLKVISTDRGSMKDFEGWAKIAKNIALLAQEEQGEAGERRFVHYVQKV